MDFVGGKMKRIISIAICIFLLLSVCVIAYAHSGRTDAKGGHWDRSTGEYHYHHGYSAHQHYDMDGDGIPDCPYDFEDKTGSSSGKSSDTSKSSSPIYAQPYSQPTLPSLETLPPNFMSSFGSISKKSPSQFATLKENTQEEVSSEMPTSVILIIFPIICIVAFVILVRSIISNSKGNDGSSTLRKIPYYNEYNQRITDAKSQEEENHKIQSVSTERYCGTPFIRQIQSLEAEVQALNSELDDETKQISKLQLELENARHLRENSQKEYEAMQKEVHSLREVIETKNHQIHTLMLELKNAEAARSSHNLAPEGISFAKNGLPVYWKPNPRKPYGDYTVYYNEKAKLYHIDPLCASYSANITHIFCVIDHARPCKKCAAGFFDFTTVPEWFQPHFSNPDYYEDDNSQYSIKLP